MSTAVTQSKNVSEEIVLVADFLSDLVLNETIIGASVNVTVSVGVDATPNYMLSGSATVSNSLVSQKLIGGLPGVIYSVWVAIKTSATNVYTQEFKLAVLSDGAIVPP
jgi:tetrahydromethanopterin S-methyltransferase subunit E